MCGTVILAAVSRDIASRAAPRRPCEIPVFLVVEVIVPLEVGA